MPTIVLAFLTLGILGIALAIFLYRRRGLKKVAFIGCVHVGSDNLRLSMLRQTYKDAKQQGTGYVFLAGDLMQRKEKVDA